MRACARYAGGAGAGRVRPRLWESTWFLTGKHGGRGQLIIAAHPPGCPSRNPSDKGPPLYDFPRCAGHTLFDLETGR